MSHVNRREVLTTGGQWALLMALAGLSPARAEPAPAVRLGDPKPFSFDALRQRAKDLAAKPYVAPAAAPSIVGDVDFDAAQKIKFRADRELFPNGPGACPVRLFHVDKYNQLPVRINEMSDGLASQIIYSADSFYYKDPEFASKLPADLGYSGFRVMDGRG